MTPATRARTIWSCVIRMLLPVLTAIAVTLALAPSSGRLALPLSITDRGLPDTSPVLRGDGAVHALVRFAERTPIVRRAAASFGGADPVALPPARPAETGRRAEAGARPVQPAEVSAAVVRFARPQVRAPPRPASA